MIEIYNITKFWKQLNTYEVGYLINVGFIYSVLFHSVYILICRLKLQEISHIGKFLYFYTIMYIIMKLNLYYLDIKKDHYKLNMYIQVRATL